MALTSLIRRFKSPGNEYRGKPFWAWNGKLDAQELRRQIRIMERMGLGGFFMHSRVGLETPYLSDEWFECVNACIDEARKLGMEAWLYDEDRWPSGAAGGIVTRDSRYRMRHLKLEMSRNSGKVKWTRDVLAAFAAEVKSGSARNVRRIPKGKTPEKHGNQDTILVFRAVTQEPSNWFNGQTYLDTLNPEAVRRFIEVTHETYRGRCGGDFGGIVPGIFTDEPDHGPTVSDVMPWTPKLPAVFRKRYGYDLTSHLVELFFDVEGRKVSEARYHYHDCVTHLFVNAFARQIGEWCEKNGLLLTGHVNREPTLSSQTRSVGSCMRFYEHMQAPGIDILTEYAREFDTAKQTSSAARQFGRKWRLTETYGCTGWDFSFAGHKAVGDWQAALGINLRCQHLAWYTMLGQAKRDYPAGIFYQSPWWELYPRVEDYFARVHAVMTIGREVRDLLVIHPVESMWTLCRKGWLDDPAVKALDAMMVRLRDTFLAGNIDFDYGDEEILSRHARISRRGGKPALLVGDASYRAAVVPPLRTIRATTLELLDDFRRKGGLVVFAGRPPDYVDTRPSEAAKELARLCERAPRAGEKLAAAVEGACRRISVTDSANREIASILYLLREDAEAFYLFVCSTGHDFRKTLHEDIPVKKRTGSLTDVWIRGFAECMGTPLEFDPETGEVYAAEATRNAAGWEIRTSLAPVGSRLFIMPKKKARFKPAKRKTLKNVRTRTLRAAKWDISLSEANVVVLDRPRFRTGEAAWHKAGEILRVDRAIRDALHIPHRGGAMVQPWARPVYAASRSVPVELEYEFDVQALPGCGLFLGIERPDLYELRLNGTLVNTDVECGWWCDRSLRKIRLEPALLRTGINKIHLKCDYNERHPGFETIYLLGSFGVKVKGTSVTVKDAPRTLGTGNWVTQGLPFYSGSVAYRRRIRPRLARGERLFVEVPSYAGTAVRVLVDGRVAGIIAWEPNEVEITRFATGGAVDLAIEVVSHRRNSHGPLHLTDRNPFWTGPGEFVTEGSKWTEEYVLKPCGLMAPPRLIVRRGV